MEAVGSSPATRPGVWVVGGCRPGLTMPRSSQNRAVAPGGATMPSQPPPTKQKVGAIETMLKQPIGGLRIVVIDTPIDFAVAIAEVDLLRHWAGDLLA